MSCSPAGPHPLFRMDWDHLDWEALDRLRAAFLDGSAGQRDYWQNERVLASYDHTFAQRIGWKWDYVMEQLERRGWRLPAGELFDWGCGTGVAGRAVLDWFGLQGVTGLRVWDRSVLAMEFARRRAQEKYPALMPKAGGQGEPFSGTLVVSHVLTELEGGQLEELLELAGKASAVLWVEPGTFEASRRLIEVRERLRHVFGVVAPCPHQGGCGMALPGNEAHWCHHFASPPPQVFTDPNWGRFAKLAGIDLRSLPLSYLVLDRRPVRPLPAGTIRVIGRPRIYKPHALVLACDASGIREERLSRRVLPEEFRELRKGKLDSLQIWRCGDAGVERVEKVTND